MENMFVQPLQKIMYLIVFRPAKSSKKDVGFRQEAKNYVIKEQKRLEIISPKPILMGY